MGQALSLSLEFVHSRDLGSVVEWAARPAMPAVPPAEGENLPRIRTCPLCSTAVACRSIAILLRLRPLLAEPSSGWIDSWTPPARVRAGYGWRPSPERLHRATSQPDTGPDGRGLLATGVLRPLGAQRAGAGADRKVHRKQPGGGGSGGPAGRRSLVERGPFHRPPPAGLPAWRARLRAPPPHRHAVGNVET